MRDIFIEIWESVRRNKLRTSLTGFSVSWGIFMLIVLLGAGNGILNTTDSNMGSILVNTMEVSPGRTSKPYDGLQEGRRIKLNRQDLELTAGENFSSVVDDVIPLLTSSDNVSVNFGKRFLNGSLLGVYPQYAEMNKTDIIAGRFINKNDIDQRRKVVVLGTSHVKHFMDGSTDYASMIGKRIRISGIVYSVVGVREIDENIMGDDLMIPFTTLATVYGRGDDISQIVFSFHGLDTEEKNEEFEDRYQAAINMMHRAAPDDESAVWINNNYTNSVIMGKARGLLLKALWIVGILTLLSGIVGVSNIMLITVKERTHEFGIRKSIGASPSSILKLILSESIAITAVFGYIGMVLGMVACRVMGKVTASSPLELMGGSYQIMQNPSVGLDVALEATLLLVLAGALAGFIPARKAARVLPVEALRAE